MEVCPLQNLQGGQHEKIFSALCADLSAPPGRTYFRRHWALGRVANENDVKMIDTMIMIIRWKV